MNLMLANLGCSGVSKISVVAIFVVVMVCGWFPNILWSINMHCSDWCISRQLWWGHQIPAYRVLTSSQHSNTVCIYYFCCLCINVKVLDCSFTLIVIASISYFHLEISISDVIVLYVLTLLAQYLLS